MWHLILLKLESTWGCVEVSGGMGSYMLEKKHHLSRVEETKHNAEQYISLDWLSEY